MIQIKMFEYIGKRMLTVKKLYNIISYCCENGIRQVITCSAVKLDANWSIGVRPGAVHTL